MAIPGLDPVTAAQFGVSTNRINRQRDFGEEQNRAQKDALHNNFGSKLRFHSRNKLPFGGWAEPERRKWLQAKGDINSQASNMGVYNSGIRDRAQDEWAYQNRQALTETLQAFWAQRRPLDIAYKQLQEAHSGQLGDLDDLRAAQQAAVASTFGGV